MPVFKRGSYWYVRFQVGGQPVKRSAGKGATRAHAVELETKLRREAFAQQRLGRKPDHLIAAAITRWLEGEAKGHKDRVNDLQRAAEWQPFITGKTLQEAATVAAGAADAWTAAGLKPATINRRMALLRRVCKLAFKKWEWLENDISGKFAALPGEGSRDVFLTKRDVRKLILAATKPLGDAITLSVYTGLRRGELLRITARDIHDKSIILDSLTKSGRPRVIPVPEPAMRALKRLPIKLSANELDSEFRKVRKVTGMTHIRWHDLRHTYGSWLAQSGANLTVIRDLMGHSTLAVTSRYAHLAPQHLREAVSKLK